MSRKLIASAVIYISVIVVFVVVNFLHFRFFRVGVVLYDALFDLLIAAVISVLVWFTLFKRAVASLSGLEKTLSVCLGIMIGVAAAIMVPTVVDRSLSIYLLEKLDQRGGGIRRDAVEDVIIKEYLPEHRLADIRLTEQMRSGTVALSGNCIHLTARGRLVVAFSRFYRAHLLPKQRDIAGEYSAHLTDPFRNSTDNVDYACTP